MGALLGGQARALVRAAKIGTVCWHAAGFCHNFMVGVLLAMDPGMTACLHHMLQFCHVLGHLNSLSMACLNINAEPAGPATWPAMARMLLPCAARSGSSSSNYQIKRASEYSTFCTMP
jgi:hypothetical protein